MRITTERGSITPPPTSLTYKARNGIFHDSCDSTAFVVTIIIIVVGSLCALGVFSPRVTPWFSRAGRPGTNTRVTGLLHYVIFSPFGFVLFQRAKSASVKPSERRMNRARLWRRSPPVTTRSKNVVTENGLFLFFFFIFHVIESFAFGI